MSRLWAYLARYRLRYAGGIACLLGSRVLAMTLPWLLGMTVDAIRSRGPVVTRYVAVIAAIAVAQAVVRTFSRFVIFNIGRDIEYDLRNDLFRHLEAQPLAFYQQRQTGDLMSRLVNDVTAVRLLLGLGILNFIDAPLAYALGLSAMLLKDVRLTAAALAVYPAAFLVVKRTSRLLMERTFRVQEGLGELSSRVQENLSGIHVVKAYACEAHEVQSFARANARFQELNLRLARVRGFIGPVMNIVGRTGVGKTTLVQLLPRLFDVDAGAVLLDGRDIRTLPLGWLRRHVGLVPQDPFLFSRSVRDNVAWALEADGNGRVEQAVRMASLTRDLAEFPHGPETIVGERGVTLSGGQKQRVALARVVAAAPRVLVLDDALSSVDAQTEREILDRLREFFRARTTILVSHRITTVKEADLIFVVDEGRIVEFGDHETLLARGGVYADLFRQQSLEGELEAI